MAPTRLTRDDLVDIAHGATFLGGGGGGTLSSALDMIAQGFPEHATVDLVSVTDAEAASGLTVACCFVGSQTKGEKVLDARAIGYALNRLGTELRERTGLSVRRIAPVDLGMQGAVIPCLIIAQRLGIAMVDGDGAGRAVPGLMMTSWALHGPSANPAVAANDAGSAMVVIEADTALDVHMIANGLCLADNFGIAAVAMWGATGAELVRALPVRDTISMARDVGRLLRTSTAPVDDVLALLTARGLEARIVTQGEITGVDTSQQDYLTVSIQDAARGLSTVKTAGENLIAFGPDQSVIGMSPDTLCWLTPVGATFSNTDVATRLHQQVVLIGIAARPVLREPAIVSLFKYFLKNVGYHGEYVPLTDIPA